MGEAGATGRGSGERTPYPCPGGRIRKTKYFRTGCVGYSEFSYMTQETRIWGEPNHLSRWELSCGGIHRA